MWKSLDGASWAPRSGRIIGDSAPPNVDAPAAPGQSAEVDAASGKISTESPFGAAVINRGPGAEVTATPPQCPGDCLAAFDADNDQDLDLVDFAQFQTLFGTTYGP